MKVPPYARYDYCVECACNFLDDHNITSYPIDLFSIIDKSPYALVPYSEIIEHFGCEVETVCKKLKSNEGRTIYQDGIYTIAYNDIGKSSGRILFTLAHELGHIYLNHMLDFKITEIPKKSNEIDMPQYEYDVLEREANAFARNILAPIPLYFFLKEKEPCNLQKIFGITYDAAVARKDLIDKDYACSKKLGLYPRFMNIYSRFIDKKNCSVCGACLIQKHGDYCPICGSKNTLKWGDGDKMKYELLNINAMGKLSKCPTCNNEETEVDGAYCQICRSYLINKCLDDSCDGTFTILPSNARFCPLCGSESTFYRYGYLKAWDYTENPLYHYDDLPFN